jgi:ketosteroid isomerase-like protein
MKTGALTILLLLPIMLMSQSNNKVTVNFLQSFADAFNAHDIKSIMAHMTDDCIFEASAGPDADGEKFTGQDQVKKAFENVFATFPDARWNNPRHFIEGDRGFSEWIFTGTKSDGTRVEVTGCDLFTFKDGKIAIKNSYRKNRIPTK